MGPATQIGSAPWDARAFRTINEGWIAPWADRFFVWLTDPPHRIVLLGALALLLFFAGGRRGRRVLLLGVIAVALSDQLAAHLFKPWADRVRPCFALPEARLLLPRQSGSASFPSNHAANAFAFAVVLFDLHPVLGWAGLAAATLISYSRAYVGVHYPGDLVAGALLGAGTALAVKALAAWLGWLRGRS